MLAAVNCLLLLEEGGRLHRYLSLSGIPLNPFALENGGSPG